MRFRLTTKPPLPLVKAWYALSPTPGIDITALKAELCSRLPSLHQHGISPNQILLSIDDFTLLDDSELDVLKENDLVCISAAPSSVPVSRKRRVSSPSPAAPRKRWKSSIPNDRHTPLATSSPFSSEASSTSSSESESESSETSSSNTTSDSDSDSESDSASDSESESDSAVETLPSKRPANGKLSGIQAKVTYLKPATINVPPGNGRPSTHSRNARRRLKRLHEKKKAEEETLAAKSLSVDSSNAIPLGTQRISAISSRPQDSIVTNAVTDPEVHPRSTDSTTVPGLATVEAEQISSTLKNKNKKKGFRRDMFGITPQRIVFSTGAEGTSDVQAISQDNGTSRRTQMITPSEKQAKGLLPPNLFVTSIEVEGDRWDRKKKKKQRDLYGYEADGAWPEKGYDDIANGEASLDYGEPDEIPVASKSTEVNWDSVDAKWDSLKAVDDVTSLSPGSLVGWKELAINPVTFTPEMLVRVARVKQLDQTGSMVTLATIRRPGEDEIAFGRAGSSADDGADEGGDMDDGAEEVQEVSFKEAANLLWKLVEV